MNNMMNNYYPMKPNGITWVQGVEGAKAYQLMPNSNALLMDSENEGIFYIKVSDNIGMCNLRTFKFSEVLEQPKIEYVTKDDFTKAIDELKGALLNGKQSIQPIKQNTNNNKQ